MSFESPPADALLSPTSQSSWPRPRTPIPPHRLAKLANALGIATPIPLSSSPDPSILSNSAPRSSSADHWRSPTPSVASTSHLTTYSASPSFQSKYLIHVVPPVHLPHETDTDGLELTPPPSSASGYHTQFRRGTLVPVFPTLQLQLYAIAKEYALPSTAGMILYLVTSSPNPGSPDPRAYQLDPSEEPGPRLSDDVWKHLWARVAKAEHGSTPPRAPTPNTVGLGFDFDGRSSPALHEVSSNANPLRPLVSGERLNTPLGTPLTPSVSTPSSSTDLRTQTASSDPSHSEINTPDSSFPPGSRAASLDLPGLNSPSIIPILAKVEFDIDKRKAAWYEPWVRSRRVNRKKRDEQGRVRAEHGSSPLVDEGSEAEVAKPAPIPLKLVDRQAVPRFLQTSDAEEDYVLESPIELDEDATARFGTIAVQDPLADVFGTDDDTWTSASPGRVEPTNRNVAPLALDSSALAEPIESEEPLIEDVDDVKEVQELWGSNSRPLLSVDIPQSQSQDASSPTTAATIRGAQTATTTTFRKAAPPPLRLVPSASHMAATAEPSPLPSTGSTKLAYLTEVSSPESEFDGEPSLRKVKTPQDEEKRVGAFFADLDLGLEFEDSGEFDETDPEDRRRSQYAMKAKLDEIERALVQFSPRRLKHELEETPMASPHSASLSVPGMATPPPAKSLSPTMSVSTGSPPSRKPGITGKGVWPAVPYSSLANAVNDEDEDADTSVGLDDFPSPPKLAINGVSRDIPVSPYKSRFSTASQELESEESKARRRELAGHEPSYPEIMPPSLRTTNSPIIPLSPDPFGRFPSAPTPPLPAVPVRLSEDAKLREPPSAPSSRITYSTFEIPTERRSSLSRNTSVTSVSGPTTSRFSVDSTDEQLAKNNRALNPVRSIRTLWRKSRKSSISSVAGVALAAQAQAKDSSGRTSPLPPLTAAQAAPVPPVPKASSPTEDEVVTNALLPPRRRPSQAPSPEPMFMTSKALQQSRTDASINSIHFDQESPYPIRRSPQPPPAPLPRTSSYQPQYTRDSQLRQNDRPPSATGSYKADPLPSPTENQKNSTRKSILKSWRSPSISQGSGNASDTSGRSSTDGKPLPEPTVRKRRPSVMEIVRGSIVSGTPIPPSPLLPEQYANANASRSRGPTPDMANGHRRGGSGRNTPSSYESSHIASPAVSGTALPPSPPRPVHLGSTPRASQEDDQFELIDTPPMGHGKTPSLSYPYHDLDHSVS
ncbi:hypothetical protein FA95DRAFT_1557087 [Auriscalpium vulgare]|uniref:Uncharacterized protein n=1 Tax=Auriscalpium vulgare TaxID=40419 RepID=A0ACB8RYI9_9AGAM|nr:hypothetical protein FA95DRAFT_1557087 [Auriscalpium vulgare]